MTYSCNPSINPYKRLLGKIKLGSNRCWIWQGAKYVSGYGKFYFLGVDNLAHRVSFEIFNDTLLIKSQHLHHKCENKLCINPTHLEIMSNSAHSSKHGNLRKINGNKTHCKHGHEFTDENTMTFVNSGGTISRKCKECNRRLNRRNRI